MIEVLKKRCKVGDIITLHTTEASFTGKLDAFEDTCVILITEDGEEFILNKDITRISIPKKGDTNASTSEISTINESPKSEVPKLEVPKLEVPKVEVEIQPIEVKTPPPPQYKAGDKIPLEILESRTSKKKSTLILPELESENKKVVPANGVITDFYVTPSITYGFITNNKKNKIFFSLSGIIDSELLKTIGNKSSNLNIPVLFNIDKDTQGKKAINIQKPKPIEQIAKIASQCIERKDFKTALSVLDQIFISFPDNYTAKKIKEEIAKKIKEEIEPKRPKNNLNQSKPNYDPNYQKATRAKNIDKDFDSAIKYYMLALENNEKRESCIKDIAMLYITLGELDKALDFTRKYENELPDTSPNNNHLYNFYRALAVKGLDVSDDLLKITNIVIYNTNRTNKARYTELLSSKAFVLIQLGDFELAREVLEEAVSIQPDNTYASRLLKALDSPNEEELSQILTESEFETLGAGGVSRLIKDTLNNYSEYKGVPPTIVESGDFTKDTLNSIRNFIEKTGRARPSERANYLLTEAKLLEQLEPDNNNDLKSVLARYCNAMALNSMYEKYSLDVVRMFYLEAFQLEENWDSTKRQFVLYLISLSNNHQELINLNSELSGIKDISNQIFSKMLFKTLNVDRFEIWNNLLNVFWVNSVIASKSLKFIYENNTLKKRGIEFLTTLGYEIKNYNEFDDFFEIWNQAREKRQRDYSRWLAFIKAIYANDNIETLANQLFDSLKDAKKNWLTILDTSRLDTISTDILDEIHQYLRQSGYRDKERYCGFAKAHVNQLITEIKEKPTKFSYEGFIPLLEKIELLLDKSFKTVESASTPKVKASILGEASIVGNDNTVPLQITVENSKDSSPIRDIKIEIIDTKDIAFISKNNVYYDSIDGGEYTIFRLNVQISDKIIKDKAATLDVICEYKTRNNEDAVSIKEQLSLRLYSEDEFEVIENPYAPIADGGPVTDKRMFYGRDEFINNRVTAILNADSKQIIIYGQKRSGKSSVLHHLKQGLDATNKTFCISFSLGEIIRDLNEYTFYYKIIYGITRALKLRKAKGEIVPEFTCPTEEEFKAKYSSNPSNGFIELIEDFQIACSPLEEWKNKKLVVMIDEFTYLYTAIRNGSTSDTIMKQWKAITQNENAKFSVVLVGQDVVPSFKKEDYARNAFGVIEDIRLTYLKEEDAKRLIEEPILNKGESRFIGRAIDAIIDYTSRNPYYIQIFCARLVDHMNAKKIIRVTEADIKEVAETFIEGSQALAPEKFDNLIRAGEEYDFIEFDDEPIIKVLRQIATGSKNIGICSRSNISLNNKELEDKILNHLVDREVLEHKQGDNYKILVKLFQEWLLRH